MGVVYRARDARLGREVAIKTLPPQIAADPTRLRRFEQEAQAASQLNHPNVVSVFDAGHEAGTPYLVTELLEGQTLRARLDEGGLPRRKAMEIGVALAQGLAAVHDRGIVHRDLKPENVFLTRDGRVKILDFGVARMVELATPANGTLPLTGEGAVMGTAGYMSPEQVRGRPADARSDVFALGATLYELVTGRQAFAGDTPVERGYAILNRDAPALDGVGQALERVIRRCLEKSPEQRFQNARDVAFALEALTETGSGEAPLVLVRTSSPRTPSLPWSLVGGLTLACIGLGVALVLALRRGAAVEDLPRSEVRAGPAASTRFTRVSFRSGWVSAARFSGDKGVVYSGAFEGERSRVVAGVIGSASTRPLSEPGSKLYDVSPTGELALGQWAPGGAKPGGLGGMVLATVPLAGGSPRPLLEGVVDAQFGPRGTMLVVRVEGPRVILEYPVGHPLVSRELPGELRARLAPSGERLAWVDTPVPFDDRGSVVIIDAEGKELARSRPHWTVEGLAWAADGKEVWFTAADTGVLRSIRALDLAGVEREVYAAPGSLVLFDLDGAGRALVARRLQRHRVFGRLPRVPREVPLSYFDGTTAVDLTSDGSAMLFIEGLGSEVNEIETYLRRFDGSAPVKLASGWGRALSPDGKWAVVSPAPPFTTLSLVPTGPGPARPLPGRYASLQSVRFFPDGKRLAIAATGTDGKPLLSVQSLPDAAEVPSLAGTELRLTAEVTRAGATEPEVFSDARLMSLVPSPDGQRLVGLTPEGKTVLVDLATGALEAVDGLEEGTFPLQWTADGRGLLVAARSLAQGDGGVASGWELHRLDLGSRRLTHLSSIGLGDMVGVEGFRRVLVTQDAATVVFGVHQTLDELFVIEGLR